MDDCSSLAWSPGCEGARVRAASESTHQHLGSDPPPPEPPRSFSAGSVDVGVSFDESVSIEGTTGTTSGARVALSEGSSGTYGGTVRASDAAGNTTELDLEVIVGEP